MSRIPFDHYEWDPMVDRDIEQMDYDAEMKNYFPEMQAERSGEYYNHKIVSNLAKAESLLQVASIMHFHLNTTMAEKRMMAEQGRQGKLTTQLSHQAVLAFVYKLSTGKMDKERGEEYLELSKSLGLILNMHAFREDVGTTDAASDLETGSNIYGDDIPVQGFTGGVPNNFLNDVDMKGAPSPNLGQLLKPQLYPPVFGPRDAESEELQQMRQDLLSSPFSMENLASDSGVGSDSTRLHSHQDTMDALDSHTAWEDMLLDSRSSPSDPYEKNEEELSTYQLMLNRAMPGIIRQGSMDPFEAVKKYPRDVPSLQEGPHSKEVEDLRSSFLDAELDPVVRACNHLLNELYPQDWIFQPADIMIFAKSVFKLRHVQSFEFSKNARRVRYLVLNNLEEMPFNALVEVLSLFSQSRILDEDMARTIFGRIQPHMRHLRHAELIKLLDVMQESGCILPSVVSALADHINGHSGLIQAQYFSHILSNVVSLDQDLGPSLSKLLDTISAEVALRPDEFHVTDVANIMVSFRKMNYRAPHMAELLRSKTKEELHRMFAQGFTMRRDPRSKEAGLRRSDLVDPDDPDNDPLRLFESGHSALQMMRIKASAEIQQDEERLAVAEKQVELMKPASQLLQDNSVEDFVGDSFVVPDAALDKIRQVMEDFREDLEARKAQLRTDISFDAPSVSSVEGEEHVDDGYDSSWESESLIMEEMEPAQTVFDKEMDELQHRLDTLRDPRDKALRDLAKDPEASHRPVFLADPSYGQIRSNLEKVAPSPPASQPRPRVSHEDQEAFLHTMSHFMLQLLPWKSEDAIRDTMMELLPYYGRNITQLNGMTASNACQLYASLEVQANHAVFKDGLAAAQTLIDVIHSTAPSIYSAEAQRQEEFDIAKQLAEDVVAFQAKVGRREAPGTDGQLAALSGKVSALKEFSSSFPSSVPSLFNTALDKIHDAETNGLTDADLTNEENVALSAGYASYMEQAFPSKDGASSMTWALEYGDSVDNKALNQEREDLRERTMLFYHDFDGYKRQFVNKTDDEHQEDVGTDAETNIGALQKIKSEKANKAKREKKMFDGNLVFPLAALARFLWSFAKADSIGSMPLIDRAFDTIHKQPSCLDSESLALTIDGMATAIESANSASPSMAAALVREDPSDAFGRAAVVLDLDGADDAGLGTFKKRMVDHFGSASPEKPSHVAVNMSDDMSVWKLNTLLLGSTFDTAKSMQRASTVANAQPRNNDVRQAWEAPQERHLLIRKLHSIHNGPSSLDDVKEFLFEEELVHNVNRLRMGSISEQEFGSGLMQRLNASACANVPMAATLRDSIADLQTEGSSSGKLSLVEAVARLKTGEAPWSELKSSKLHDVVADAYMGSSLEDHDTDNTAECMQQVKEKQKRFFSDMYTQLTAHQLFGRSTSLDDLEGRILEENMERVNKLGSLIAMNEDFLDPEFYSSDVTAAMMRALKTHSDVVTSNDNLLQFYKEVVLSSASKLAEGGLLRDFENSVGHNLSSLIDSLSRNSDSRDYELRQELVDIALAKVESLHPSCMCGIMQSLAGPNAKSVSEQDVQSVQRVATEAYARIDEFSSSNLIRLLQIAHDSREAHSVHILSGYKVNKAVKNASLHFDSFSPSQWGDLLSACSAFRVRDDNIAHELNTELRRSSILQRIDSTGCARLLAAGSNLACLTQDSTRALVSHLDTLLRSGTHDVDLNALCHAGEALGVIALSESTDEETRRLCFEAYKNIVQTSKEYDIATSYGLVFAHRAFAAAGIHDTSLDEDMAHAQSLLVQVHGTSQPLRSDTTSAGAFVARDLADHVLKTKPGAVKNYFCEEAGFCVDVALPQEKECFVVCTPEVCISGTKQLMGRFHAHCALLEKHWWVVKRVWYDDWVSQGPSTQKRSDLLARV